MGLEVKLKKLKTVLSVIGVLCLLMHEKHSQQYDPQCHKCQYLQGIIKSSLLWFNYILELYGF